MRNRTTLIALTAALVLAACGGADGAAEDPIEPAGQETTEPAVGEPSASDSEAGTDVAGETLAVGATDLGEVLVDGDGMTLYAFLPDAQGTPTCTDGCLATWPAFEGPAGAGDGVDASLLGTVEHPSGVTMTTYDGWPLYRFASDTAPGDTNGQGLGDNWYVVAPDGQAVTGP